MTYSPSDDAVALMIARRIDATERLTRAVCNAFASKESVASVLICMMRLEDLESAVETMEKVGTPYRTKVDF